ncbi:Crp/Fnr family transcriptional regulator [Chryseobacterium chendengshani]|uniref:Crp/Fnr family transcriptional regulator n=1 Tax=unclassified Chryseobacterium TaxID=2593645 RepID=UPI001C63F1E8|nr:MULTISPECIES: Crp/Fnr family transcriptional regulator [unclassified Chryseobacterium]MBW7674308.1 Crp/Fnr family transcriptional regulator [Chryseobacterium sp. LJ756]MBW8522902.1 Crp/Fnr family transcriptional regulator [Chryseobacterium sp. LJ668]QYK16431.1 Crp/Fnr family transcriptional regulator [Chryseobacterium sp. LJ668]
MIIDEQLLKAHGAQIITLEKDEYLISTHTYPYNYYQIKSGSLKITSDKIGLNEFIHQISGIGDPVGETFLFSESLYTVNAVALSQITVYALGRDEFYKLLEKNPETTVKLYEYTCLHINYHQILMNKVAYSDSRNRIMAVIDYLKIKEKKFRRFQYEIPYTRKQLAGMTGLRTETVVRIVKLMEKENFVKIVDGKIFY